MKKSIVVALTLISSFSAFAGEALPSRFIGADYSGVYDCIGHDSHDGKYTGTLTMTINPAQSTGSYGVYSFTTETPGLGPYQGEAVSLGKMLAIHFGLPDPKSKDHGTGITTVEHHKHDKLTLHIFYYEPEYNGGNNGTEDCTRR